MTMFFEASTHFESAWHVETNFKKRKQKMKNIFLLFMLGWLTTTPALAQFTIARSTFGSGGAAVSNSEFKISGTIGQSFIGTTLNGTHGSLAGFWYRKPVDIPTNAEEDAPGNPSVPAEFRLQQNHPNPFNPSTVIQFALPKSSSVSLKIYNFLGQEVATLIDHELAAGEHQLTFDASGLSSGIYVYRLHAGEFSSVKRMTLVK
jgi:hypothetical protein